MKPLKVLPNRELFDSLIEIVEQGETTSFVVAGMSMWPLMRHGKDIVFIEKCYESEIKKGDIVLMQTPENTYLLHRIMKRMGSTIITAGDNKCVYDGEFDISCVRAKVFMIKRGERMISCDAVGWRMLFCVWRLAFPVRGKLLFIIRRFLGYRKSDKIEGER